MKKNALKVFIIIGSFFFSFLSFSFTEKTIKLQQDLLKELSHSDKEIYQRVFDYKNQIEKDAYVITSKLCEGYRRAHKMGPPSYHSKYVWPKSESLGAWANLLKKGLNQPFSAMGGIKSDLLYVNNIGFFSPESWIISAYSLILINSWGFLQSAVHCLETTNKAKLKKFASAIIDFDAYASVPSHAIGFIAGGKVVELILRSSRFLLTFAFRSLVSRFSLTIPPSYIKGTIYSAVAGAGFYAAYKLKKMSDIEDVLVDLMNESEETMHLNKVNRLRYLLSDSSYKLLSAFQKEQKLREKNKVTKEQLENLYIDFEDSVKSFTEEDIKIMEEDYQDLLNNNQDNQNDKLIYLYKNTLPAVKIALKRINSNQNEAQQSAL